MTEEQPVVVPGQKYGCFLHLNGKPQLIPICRSIDTMWAFAQLAEVGQVTLKLHADITDEDRCQRGPEGKPLGSVTPFTAYETLAEWTARGPKPA